MFTPDKAFSGFSVDNIDRARAFYSDTLGMTVTTNEMGFLNLQLANGASILIYGKDNHTPASYTVLNFEVDDIDAAVDDLNTRGVVTKIYDDNEFLPTDERGIMHAQDPSDGPSIAWFTDPAGNVLSIMQPN